MPSSGGNRADVRLLAALVVAYALGVVTVIVLGAVAVAALPAVVPSVSPFLLSPLVAALLEPTVSKLLPAAVLAWATARFSPARRAVLRATPARFGAAGGAVVGIVEIAAKLLATGGMFGGVRTVTGGVLAAALLHVAFGGLVGNAVFRSTPDRRRPWHRPSVATLLAILLHLSWNGVHVLRMVRRVQ